MMKKKMLLVPAVLLLLAACGGGGNKKTTPVIVTPTPTQGQVTPTPTEPVTPTPTESPVTPTPTPTPTEPVTPTPTPSPEVAAIVSGTEADANANPGNWYYWNDKNNEGSNVVVDEEELYVENGEKIHLAYICDSGACNYGFQVFYKDSNLQDGVKYKQSFTVTSKIACTIEFINETIDFEANEEKEVELHYWQTSGISFKAVFKVAANDDNEVVIDNFKTEVSLVLDAPLNLAVSEEGVVTFAAAQHATSYQITVTDEQGNTVDGYEAINIVSGNVFEGFEDLPAGIYKVKARSLADGFVMSEWSTPVTLIKGEVAVDPFHNYDDENKTFGFGEEAVAVANPGYLYHWNDQGWVANNVTVNKAEIVNGTISAIFNIVHVKNGDEGFAFQIFFKNEFLQAGKTYELSLTFNTEVAGKIGLNGSGLEKIEVVAGANELTRIYEESGSAASLSLQIPASLVDGDHNNTISLSNISWTEVE